MLLPLIEHSLCEADADPANLVLEITETALMEDFEAGETFARGVADLGCGLALDDFGTGYGELHRPQEAARSTPSRSTSSSYATSS